MKKTEYFHKLFVLFVIIVFSMAACNPDNDDVKSNGDKTPTVTQVVVSAAFDVSVVNRGATLQFSAAVSGENSPAQTVIWDVVDINGDALPPGGTSINSAGLLSAAANEPLDTLIIRAASTIDNSKVGEKEISVISPAVSILISLDDPMYAQYLTVNVNLRLSSGAWNITFPQNTDERKTLERELAQFFILNNSGAQFELTGNQWLDGHEFDDSDYTWSGLSWVQVPWGMTSHLNFEFRVDFIAGAPRVSGFIADYLPMTVTLVEEKLEEIKNLTNITGELSIGLSSAVLTGL